MNARSRRILLGCSTVLLAVAWFGEPRISWADEPRPRRLIYNSDGSNIFIFKKPPMEPEDVYARVDEVAGTGVTSFFICPCAGLPMYFPSNVGEMLGADLTPRAAELIQRERLGQAEPARYSLARAALNLKSLVEAGHDPIGLVVDRARQKKLEVFITFRMNELHGVFAKTPVDDLLVSRFWREHPEWRVGGGGYKGGALDFAVPEVRAHRLAQLQECCRRYPIDGLELDWQRWPSYFKPPEAKKNIPVMTQFVRQVRKLTNECGRKRGRPILLAVRVMPTIEESLALGLDPVTWAKEGLIDFLTVSRFLHVDEGSLDIQGYKQAITNLPIYGNIMLTDPDGYRREARKLWADGVDGICLFNFFCPREYGKEPPFELLKELGDPKKIRLDAGS